MNTNVNPRVASAMTLDGPYSTIRINDADVFDYVIMRSRQLLATLRNMPAGEYSAPLITLARGIAAQLVQKIKACKFARSSSLAVQLVSLLLAIQNDEIGPCDILWLAQQMSDELVCALQVIAGGAL